MFTSLYLDIASNHPYRIHSQFYWIKINQHIEQSIKYKLMSCTYLQLNLMPVQPFAALAPYHSIATNSFLSDRFIVHHPVLGMNFLTHFITVVLISLFHTYRIILHVPFQHAASHN